MIVQILGVRELTAALARLGPQWVAEIGATNRRLGQEIIDVAFPKPLAVGAGSGATPRPSASRNVLQIRAGGSWRAAHVPVQQWGRRWAPRDVARPYILRAAKDKLPVVQEEYLRKLLELARRAGIEAHLTIA